MNTKRFMGNFVSGALALAALLLVLLAGCENVSIPDTVSNTVNSEKGYVNLRIPGGGTKTVMPQDMGPKKFRAEFISSSGGGTEPLVSHFEGNQALIELPPGDYTLKLFGYINSEQPPIAKGSLPVRIYSGKNTDVSLVLETQPLTADFTGSGSFEWNFTANLPESELKSAGLRIEKNGSSVDGADTSAPAREEFSLDAGYYNVTTTVENIFGSKSVYFETLWIYPGMRSVWNLNVSGEDFFGADGTSKINWSFDPETPPVLLTEVKDVYQGDTVVFNVEKKHSSYIFYVDGEAMQNSGSTSFTLITEDMAPGSHEISIVGINESGIPWSSSARIKILKKAAPRTMALAFPDMYLGESVADSTGNIYIAAYEKASLNKAVLIKTSPEGEVIWQKTSNGSDRSELRALVIGEDNNIYACGIYRGVFDFGGESVSGTSSIENPFVACFDSDGNNKWLRSSLSGTSYGGFGSIAADGTGIYCAGMFYYSRDFGNGVVINSNSSARFDSPMIVKYDFSGTPLWGITSTKNRCASIDDLVVENNILYACGYTNGSGNSPFQWGNLPVLNATGYNYNGWAAAFSTDNGAASWAVLAPVGGSSGFSGLSVRDAYVYASGYYDPSVSALDNENTMRGLVAKYSAASGEVIWSKTTDVSGVRYLKVYADDSALLAAGYDKSSGMKKSVVASYDTEGNQGIPRTVTGGQESAFHNISAASGSLYVTGDQKGSGEYLYDGIAGPVSGLSAGNNGVLIRYMK